MSAEFPNMLPTLKASPIKGCNPIYAPPAPINLIQNVHISTLQEGYRMMIQAKLESIPNRRRADRPAPHTQLNNDGMLRFSNPPTQFPPAHRALDERAISHCRRNRSNSFASWGAKVKHISTDAGMAGAYHRFVYLRRTCFVL